MLIILQSLAGWKPAPQHQTNRKPTLQNSDFWPFYLSRNLLLGLLGISMIAGMAYSQSELVYRVLDFDTISYENLNKNIHLEEVKNNRLVGVSAYEGGYQVQLQQGRDGSTAAYCDNSDGSKRLGLSWTFTLNQIQPDPVRMAGWSRAENVEGNPDSDYSLYIDLIYSDGTPSWGHQVPFPTGTHDWVEKKVYIFPEKPIKTLYAYALFRSKKGRAWFDDVSIQKPVLQTGLIRLDGLSVQKGRMPQRTMTQQNFNAKDLTVELDPTTGGVNSLLVRQKSILAPDAAGGFLIRDVSAGSGYYAFQNGHCEPLSNQLNLKISQSDLAIHVEGELEDLRREPRAMNLLFSLPVNAIGGRWGDHLTDSREIAAPEEYFSWIQIDTGSNGQLSRYPFACVSTNEYGIALGYDLGTPCQWRLGYSTGANSLYVSMDLGLHPETKNFPSKAKFHFVIFAIDPAWGFRSATDSYYRIFPDYFQVRSHDQGIWMPFTDISTIQGWQDFGFTYHEGNNNVSFDDQSDILSFRYSEPSTWWMNMASDIPRTYEAAMAQVENLAKSSTNSSLMKEAKALLASGSLDENGRYQMLFRNEPWSNGAVFSLNPSPYLPGEITDASLMWNDSIAERLYGSNAKGTLDGEYLDSLEGYVTADLNFCEGHFRSVTAPLTFTLDSRRLVIHKAFSIFEFTRYMSEQMHSRGKLFFANAVPARFAFLCPWLDVMGTETNWISEGQFSPESDETMNYRRTLCGQKPYLFLMNTNFNDMSYAIVEKYFLRCLFYGMYPSMFSHNAADEPYWQNTTLYNRDRPLFQKYQPLIKKVAEAGWEPVTGVRAANDAIRIERYGSIEKKSIYLTVYNSQNTSISIAVTGENELNRKGRWEELLSGKTGEWNGGLESEIGAKATQVYRLYSLENDSKVKGSALN